MSADSITPPPHADSPVGVDLGEALEAGRYNWYLKTLVFLTAVTIVFDGADSQLLGIAIPSIMADWALPRSAFAALLAVGIFGMMLGGALGGLAGDRFGRKTALVGSVLIFGLFTVAIAFADSVKVLGLLRFLAGLGLGGAMPNATALVAEYVPRSKRPLAITLTIVCVPLGGMLAAWMAGRILPLHGWRTLFLIGGLAPLLVAVLLLAALAESPRYLARRLNRRLQLFRFLYRSGHRYPPETIFVIRDEAPNAKPSLRELFSSGLSRDTLALWAAFFSCLLAIYASFGWIPSLLSGAGLSIPLASKGLFYFNLGGVAGAVLGGAIITRIGSKPIMLTLAGSALACALILSGIHIDPGAPGTLLIMLTAFGTMINAVQTTMFALAANVYPSAFRATGIGTAVSVGRIGGVLSTYIGSWAIASGGSRSYFLVIAAAMAIALVSLALVRRHIPPMPSSRATG